jgi:2-polyprenyl-6-methoxyphenol hydroxylase-like FAD-dependent oxidoreductase
MQKAAADACGFLIAGGGPAGLGAAIKLKQLAMGDPQKWVVERPAGQYCITLNNRKIVLLSPRGRVRCGYRQS